MTNLCVQGRGHSEGGIPPLQIPDAVVRQAWAEDIRSLQTVKSCFPEQSTDTAPALQRPGLGARVSSPGRSTKIYTPGCKEQGERLTPRRTPARFGL